MLCIGWKPRVEAAVVAMGTAVVETAMVETAVAVEEKARQGGEA